MRESDNRHELPFRVRNFEIKIVREAKYGENEFPFLCNPRCICR
jgi:hypothetical protein